MRRINGTRTVTRLAAIVLFAAVIVLASSVAAFAVDNSTIASATPIPTPLPYSFSLDGGLSIYGDSAVFSFANMKAGDTLSAGVTGYNGFYMEVYAPGTTDINEADPVEWLPCAVGDITYVVPADGTYYLHVWAPPADPDSGEPAAVGTTDLWAGVLKKTTLTVGTTYFTQTGEGSSAAASVVVPFDAYCDFNGFLRSAAGSLPAEPVQVLRQYVGGRMTPVMTAWTYKDGTFEYPAFSAGIRRKAVYTFQYAGTDVDTDTAQGLGYSNAQVTITPRPLITTPASSSSTVTHGRAFSVYGSLLPRHTAGTYPVKLYCERYESGKWRLRKTVSAKAYNSYYTNEILGYYSEPSTKYLASVSLPYAGKWRIRAYHGDADHYGTYTKYKSYTAR